MSGMTAPVETDVVDTPEPALASAATGAPGGAVPPTARAKVSPGPLGVFLIAALVPTIFTPAVFSPTFSPKLALLLLVGAVGAVPLVRLARSSQATWAARGALAFLVVGLIAALLSAAPAIGFFGLYDWGTGWLFWFGCAGAFALGARLKPDQLNWALAGIVVAAVANSIAAVVQVVANPSGALSLYQGKQADGFLGNPIHLEALLLGALALIARQASLGKARMWWWPGVLLISVALELTLERVALPIAVAIIVLSLVCYGLRRAAPFAVLTLVGYGIGYVSAGSGLGSRVASGTSTTTYGTRFNIWKLALEGVVHHPFVGVGPGEVISVIAPHVNASFAAHLGPGTLPFDSHDFIIEVVATTGVLGLAAFFTWLGGAALKARGPFLACAVAMLVVELIEPINVGITPEALLALGVATVSIAGQPVGLLALSSWLRHPRAAPKTGSVPVAGLPEAGDVHDDLASSEGRARGRLLRPSVLATVVLVVAALFVGSTMVLGDHDLLTSDQDIAPQAKVSSGLDANRVLPYWPDSAVAIAQGYLFASNISHSGSRPLEQALAWYVTAAGRDPADPILRAEIGTLELQLGNRLAAERQDLRSLRLDPWTFLALESLGTIAREDHDWRTSVYWYKKALAVAPAGNDVAHLISEDEAHLQPTG
jgi:hypothetical protein